MAHGLYSPLPNATQAFSRHNNQPQSGSPDARSLITQAIDEVTPRTDHRNPVASKDCWALGIPRHKKRLETSEALLVLASLLCLVAAIVTVSPYSSIPWRLGLKRQFQIIGVLLNGMNQCFLTLAPKVFVLFEARYGSSCLQNYDAILRNSYSGAHTNIFWRGILITVVIIPVSLGIAYKEFDHGVGSNTNPESARNTYGLTAPAGLQESSAGGIGVSFMANGTLSFVSATFMDPPMPSFPQAYGFNTLLLSNTSSARLDAPFPDNVTSIQRALMVDEAYMLTAEVHATVTTFNKSIGAQREDDAFWNSYINQMDDTADKYIGGGHGAKDGSQSSSQEFSRDAYLISLLHKQNLFNGQALFIMMNDLGSRNTSWMMASLISVVGPADLEADRKNAEAFRKGAMLFHTRRESCIGTWRITYNSIQLVKGACEYLGDFSDSRRQSQWLVPTFSTVIAGVYWSRATALMGFYNWSENKTIFYDPNPEHVQRSEVIYTVKDEGVSMRPVMNASPLLFLVFIIQPTLTIILLLASILMFRTPLDKGFGLISLLAGIKTETLHLLAGASVSGKLKEALRVRVVVHQPLTLDGRPGHPRNGYILGDGLPNGKLAHPMNFSELFGRLRFRTSRRRHASWTELRDNQEHGH